MSPKVITVFGATGAQGGSVVESLIRNKDKAFLIRAITRNPHSERAISLSARGIEVVKADGLNKGELLAALEGSWGLFVNTNSDDESLQSPEGPNEVDLGHNIIDCAAEAGIQHVIYSAAVSAAENTAGRISIKAFDNKHEVELYARGKHEFETFTPIYVGWYLENFLVTDLAPVFGGFPVQADEEGFMTLAVPRWGGNEDVPFIGINDDFGDLVHGILLDPQKWNGKCVQAVSTIASFAQVVERFEKVTGKRSRFAPLKSWSDLQTHGVPSLEMVRSMFGFTQYTSGRYFGLETNKSDAEDLKKDAGEAKGLVDRLVGLEDWFKREFSDKEVVQ